MTLDIREVYEWHLENARECLGRADLESQAVMHSDFAKALRPYLPAQPCGICRGSGLQYLHDSDGYDIVPCECQAV